MRFWFEPKLQPFLKPNQVVFLNEPKAPVQAQFSRPVAGTLKGDAVKDSLMSECWNVQNDTVYIYVALIMLAW